MKSTAPVLAPHTWRFGPQLLADKLTRFRLWAPDLDAAVTLEVEGLAPLSMHAPSDSELPGPAAGRDGWHFADAACGVGARYRFRLPDGTCVPDPASRRQHGDVHDASVVVDGRGYAWRNPDWKGRPWHETVLYELHVGALGGFLGVMAQLPAIAALGFTAIELMPIADFPGTRNWGYDGVLPYAPDASYGTPDQLRELIDAAHDLKLMVFLDVVYNHFGPDGNYLGQYAKSFFRANTPTPWGPAIDFGKAEVRRYFSENALYWLSEFRFDGLRFDAVHAIIDPDWLDQTARMLRLAMPADRQIHLTLENEHNAARHLGSTFDAQWNDDGHNVLHVLLTGEDHGYYADFVAQPAHDLARVLAEGFIYQGQVSEHLSTDGQPVYRGEPSAHLPATAFILFLQNHDQIGNRALGQRLTSLIAADALRAAIALQLLCPQIPLCFMGEEVGSTNPFLFFTDHHAELAEAVRCGRRREFAKFPTYADETSRATIPDPNHPSTFERSIPQPAAVDPQRWAELYRTLLTLRRRALFPLLPTIVSGGASALGPAAISASWHSVTRNARHTLTIYSNLGPHAVPLNAARRPPRAPLLFQSSPHASAHAEAATGTLAPFTTLAWLNSHTQIS